ncbi:MAG: WbqC family protein [Thermodesulfobacteriota bacterium]|nr:WbqC family protein [Thermodesulfobacteriota bacterium]
MIVSTYQPFFAPFPGFFQKAHLSDVMVILDNVQFPQRTTWLTRNRFKNEQGVLWVSVPVWRKGLGLQSINKVKICWEGRWRRKHLESLKSSYANAPYFEDLVGFIERMFSGQFENLIDLTMAIIMYLKEQLMIDTQLVLLSALDVKGKGNELLVNICRKLKSFDYLAQSSAKKYINQELFSSSGIRLHFFSPHSPVYPQLWGEFIHNLSAFDLLFNCGEKSHEILFLR